MNSTDYQTLLIHPYAEKSYLDYAMAVVTHRALGQVEDGKKPVQRRILFAMHDMGLTHAAKPRKCAAMVGEVLGKYHPHGDASVYDALVRMAQPFTLRYPLIEGQGNFGSRDGDAAAAMRYTEARLTPVASLLLSELDAGTADFIPNYDGSHTEPNRLPARLPFLLLNGAIGIAVGMACDLPPHNLREVAAAAIAVLQNPDVSVDELLDLMPGPDFPTGGQLISSRSEIRAAYGTGRGLLRLRARWKKEELARGQWQLVVTEFPYQVSAKKVLEEIEVLTNPQPRPGKKTLDQQQINLKQVALEFLEKVADESGKEDDVRLVISPRSSKLNPDELMAFLLANTSLEQSVSVNNTAIGLDGRPATKDLKTLLSEWVAYRVETVTRRTRHSLDGILRRIHLLEGRMAVYLNVDEVIQVIRNADNPAADLMAKFALTKVQADDILEMRLRQLARLDGIKVEKELAASRVEQARLETLLADSSAMRQLIVGEITADAEKFGDDRRTLIQEEARTTTQPVVVDEPVTIILSKNLWIRAKSGHDLPEDSISYRAGDSQMFVLPARTTESIYFLDNLGRAYSVAVSALPTGRGDGAPLTAFIELQPGARIMHAIAGSSEESFLFAGQNGYGFRAPLKALLSRQKAGKAFLTLEEGELPLPPVPARPGYVVCGSSGGKLLAFPVEEVKTLDKGGKGVQLMVLDDGLISHLTCTPEPRYTGWARIGDKRLPVDIAGDDWSRHCLHRARKGAFLPKHAVLESDRPT